MGDAVVIFDRVWKKFRRGERHDSLRDLIPAAARSLFARRNGRELDEEEFWAIEDVSFEVGAGEALGIIGPNGAGKSTTLKLLTKILKPSRGACQVNGRIGALIEIAAGFHPDLTGRENVYLQGAVMGMKRSEIATKFDAIVDFSGTGAFIDTPAKRYSSGMNARLGFSIAAHLDPDVLIIDEVLSVGDMSFQEKCIERMREFKRQGVTIVFVSHNLQAVSQLCDRALYLRHSAQRIGSATEVVDHYVRDTHAPIHIATDSDLELLSVKLTMPGGSVVSGPIVPGTVLRLTVSLKPKRELRDVTFAFGVYRSADLLKVYDGHFRDGSLGLTVLKPDEVVQLDFDFTAHLTRGQYYVETFVLDNPTQRFLLMLRPAAHLTVHEGQTWGGVADLEVKPSVSVRDGMD